MYLICSHIYICIGQVQYIFLFIRDLLIYSCLFVCICEIRFPIYVCVCVCDVLSLLVPPSWPLPVLTRVWTVSDATLTASLIRNKCAPFTGWARLKLTSNNARSVLRLTGPRLLSLALSLAMSVCVASFILHFFFICTRWLDHGCSTRDNSWMYKANGLHVQTKWPIFLVDGQQINYIVFIFPRLN